MGVPSGSFSHTASGRLQVVFSAEFSATSGSDWGSGSDELVLLCTVGSGADLQKAYLRLSGANTATLERDYTAGASVPVALAVSTWDWNGPGTVRAKNIRIACRLFAAPP